MTIDMALMSAVGIALALLLGALIGAERQWRCRNAGLRTTALVSTGSALFTVLGAEAFGDGDPSRVAAQIASGIGFIGAGVIIKDGGSLSGINTAATLWAAAAVGALSGAGMPVLALVGTACIVFAHMVLRPLGWRIERRTVPDAAGGDTGGASPVIAD